MMSKNPAPCRQEAQSPSTKYTIEVDISIDELYRTMQSIHLDSSKTDIYETIPPDTLYTASGIDEPKPGSETSSTNSMQFLLVELDKSVESRQ